MAEMNTITLYQEIDDDAFNELQLRDNIEEYEVAYETDDANDDDNIVYIRGEEPNDESRFLWDTANTLALIAAVKKHYKDIYGFGRRNGAMWELVCKEIGELGYWIKPSACSKKWRYLLRSYDAVKEQTKKSNRYQFEYFAQIDEIMKDNPFTRTTYIVDVGNFQHRFEEGKPIVDRAEFEKKFFAKRGVKRLRDGQHKEMDDFLQMDEGDNRKKTTRERIAMLELVILRRRKELERQKLELFNEWLEYKLKGHHT